MEEIKRVIDEVCQKLFGAKAAVELTRPAEQFGDFATNVALQLAAKTGKKPRDVAEALQKELSEILKDKVAKIDVAGPGFINFTLADAVLSSQLAKIDANYGQNDLYKGQTIVIEHTDPNPFKEFHIGHAYSNTIGEALGRLFKAAGAKVHQVSYHGDVGLHVAMAIYGLKQAGKSPQNLDIKTLAEAYALGARRYQEDDNAKAEIQAVNQKIYDKSDPELNKLYERGEALSFAYFDEIYKRLGSGFEKKYRESEVGPSGLQIVKKHLNKTFEESDGAIIYRGEKVGLHTRVFITKQGLPTYEAKELGLALAKQKDYPGAAAFVVVTANEIDDYFRVLLAALAEIDAELAAKIRHVSHGVVKLPGGKMSSRSGEVITLNEVLDMLGTSVKKVAKQPEALESNVLGALKYAFLKHRVGGDIIFDIEESISLEGNSGPYLQYAYARARSILQRAKGEVQRAKPKKLSPLTPQPSVLERDERSLVRKLTEYPEVVENAVNELLPNHICTYLYELAQTFNRFYEGNRVIGDPRENERLALVKAYAQVLKNGLTLLNIPAPEKM